VVQESTPPEYAHLKIGNRVTITDYYVPTADRWTQRAPERLDRQLATSAKTMAASIFARSTVRAVVQIDSEDALEQPVNAIG
jgi:hypothetical protein